MSAPERNIDIQGQFLCLGFPPWKKPYIKCFLNSSVADVVFCRNLNDLINRLVANKEASVVMWGALQPADLIERISAHTTSIIRVEDGFLRSVGLGKYYIPPVSLVFDRKGMYYDATQVSELESILEEAAFDQKLLLRAAELVRQIKQFKLSKYNVGAGDELAPLVARRNQGDFASKKMLLVPGQVEGDASLAKGSANLKTDCALLECVRQANPSAFILYKPHPDVVSGNQKNTVKVSSALVDHIVTQSDIHDCLALVDEVHTMTSLVGFEALIRNKKVVTYGQPFYAGWGLTTDKLSFESARRSRVLTLEQLVAGVLIIYPRYYDYELGLFISAEQALKKIQQQKQQYIESGAAFDLNANRLKRFTIKTLNLIKSILFGLQK